MRTIKKPSVNRWRRVLSLSNGLLAGFKRLDRPRKIAVGAFVAGFGLLGVHVVSSAFAATYVVSLEAEAGQVTGLAGAGSVANASNNAAVRFGSGGGGGGGAAVAWPLKVGADKRHLVDQNNKPFLYVADTAWSLLEYNTLTDIKRYIDIRKTQGFTTIQTNVIWDLYNSKGTQYEKPLTNNDFSQPNEAYWTKVDQALDYAKSKDMLLTLGTLWFSKHGSWESNGPAPSASAFAGYSTWLGGRYKDKGNLVWVMGGDDETSTMPDIKNAGANALQAADPNHLITYHPRWDDYGLSNQTWHDYNEFQANMNDLSGAPHVLIRKGLSEQPGKPILDAEPAYFPGTCCGSDRNTTEQKNRRNGWWAILADGMGVVFGGGGESWGIGWNGIDWNQYQLPAPQHTANIARILSKVSWASLVSDWDNATFTGGRGSASGDADYAIGGRSADGKLGVLYMPSSRSVTVDLSKFSGPVQAYWFDPTTAQASGAAQQLANTGSQAMSPPGNNAAGDSDWVLILSTMPVN